MGPLSEESGEHELATACVDPDNASMGPLSEESGGSSSLPTGSPLSAKSLQWGRSPKRAESTRARLRSNSAGPCFNGAALRRERRGHGEERERCRLGDASMGPLSEESGEPGQRRCDAASGRASMGPLSEESGEEPREEKKLAKSKLQWGRSPKRAERAVDPFHLRPFPTCFNGAALRRERRVSVLSHVESSTETLQWGRSPKRAERPLQRRRLQQLSRRFNGAALRRERRDCLCPWFSTVIWYELQWGRSPKRAERDLHDGTPRHPERLLQWGRSPKRAERVGPS